MNQAGVRSNPSKHKTTKKNKLLFLLILLLAAVLSSPGRSTELQPIELRTEYRVNPLGISTAIPQLSWSLESETRNCSQSAFRILVAESAKLLALETGSLWDSGRVESKETLNIPYSGIQLISGQKCFWKVRVWDENGQASEWSNPSSWETALLKPTDWKAIWINDGKANPEKDSDFYKKDPAPLFRKEFILEKKPIEARLYISGLGYYEASLNGHRICDQVLDPGWTDYSDRILYSTYDVTTQLRKGANCLSGVLGNGWYNPLPLRMWGRRNLREHLTIGRPCLIAQLEIRFPDGSSRCVVTDESWKVHEGPILKNNIYLGELYDARCELPVWDIAGFDDSAWKSAASAPNPGGRLEAQSQPPILAKEELHPINISEPCPGLFIVDFGENFAGWARLQVEAPSGTKILLRYGELLYPDGTLNPMTSVCGQIKGLRDDGSPVGGPGAPEVAVQQDVYICKGEGKEVYVPAFTFHAFRYVEVTGFPGRPGPEAITGIRLHADVESVGNFSCSDPIFNRIQEMTRRTFLSNLFSVQSDCPHRERFAYGGDIAVTCEAFMMNFNMASFYTKTVRDWQDSAFPDGMLTDTAPFVGIHYCGVAWAMVHPLLQAELYRYYGSQRLIKEQYPTARRWLDQVKIQYPDHIVTEGLSDHEGLEPAPPPPMVTPLYAEATRILKRLADILVLKEDSNGYQKLFLDIQKTYLDRFLKRGTGRVDPSTQASQAMALSLDLLPEEEREIALQVLINKIQEEHDGHLSTGIFGTNFLLEILSRTGHADLAAAIVRKTTFPGWGNMLKNGATTLWEHWEFSDNTFSHNHPMFGTVSTWFFNWLAGIQAHPRAKGFDRFYIRPQPVEGITWVKADYMSARGAIRVFWERDKEEFVLKITIPPNTRAQVFIPTSDYESIREIGKPGTDHPGKINWETGKGYGSCEIGSGTYTFSAVYK